MTRVVPIVRSGILAEEFCQRVRSAQVAAVFDRSVHLSAGDTFICIGGAEIGNGPLTLVADGSFRVADLGVRPGQRAVVTERRIRIGDGIALTFDRCEPWRPQAWPAQSSPARLIDTLGALARMASVEAPPEGLAREVFCRHEAKGVLSRVARGRIASFEQWLSAARMPLNSNVALPHPVHGLIGLGPGLTPAGDDFLVGALALLDALAERQAGSALAHALAAASPRSTSPLSHCFLRAAAAGHLGENLHRAVSCVVAGDAGPAIAAIRTIGHSSGWDMLAGIAATLKVVAACAASTTPLPTGHPVELSESLDSRTWVQ